MKRNKKCFSSIIWLLICIMVITCLMPITCFATEKQNKTVRVAYAIEPGYQEGNAGEYKTGFGYEYLQKIAKLNGWNYEYVYGPFHELLTKLENGEIDLMGQLSYSPERAQKISYGTNEQGRKSFYLYVNKKNNSIDPKDYSTINGKNIGVCKGKIQKTKWEKWCKDNNVKCSITEYDYLKECRDALNSGKIDGLIEGRIQLDKSTANWEALFAFDSASFYFCVNKNRPDLLNELNTAQTEILEENPFYNEKVQSRNMNPVSSMAINLNQKEKKWLKDHDYEIKFGYLQGFPPLCYQDQDGTCQGVAADAFSAIEKQYADKNVDFEAVVYKDYTTMFNDLKKGDISIAWPVYDDYWKAEENGYAVTDPLVKTSMMLVYDGKYTNKTIKKIGVINTGSLPKTYAQIHYPNSKFQEYDSYKSAIRAVLKKEVESVLYVSTTYNVDVLTNDELKKLNMTTLPESFGISFAVSPENDALNSFLDKGIMLFGEAGVNHSLITNSAVEKEITLKDYFEQHPYIGVFTIVIILTAIAAIIFLIVYKNMSIRIKSSQAEKKIYERLSNSDTLTGLYNRKMVFRRCRELLDEHPHEQFVMAHVDMKHFRLYNTFFGDEAGDQLLCDVADIFRGISKDYEYWAYGRIEADVFCLFFPYDEEKYHKHLSDAMEYLKSYRTDFLIEPALGLYFVTDPEMPMEAMFTRASLAAKEVKAGMPDSTVIYNAALEKALNERLQIINEMQQAIDDEQFQVYLQPKYSLRTNKIVGAEALVRWVHPTKGMVSPGYFIPIFESNGFITTLDRYMWEHVCRLLSDWKKENKKLLPVSVNVSRLSMFGSTTVDFLKELVSKYDIDPKYLELELTESAYMDDPEEMKLQMKALRDAGFTILLDDFGSGYSSLNTLREIPVDILKLDMKFLSLDNNDLRGGVVLSSIVRRGKLLNLAVVAEGVELQEQADYLKSIGCEYVQGFLFARPMPVSEYEKLLINSSKPISLVNQPVIDHVARIIAETGSATYAMGTVIPTPLACLEYAEQGFNFLRVNPEFYTEFHITEESIPMSSIFKTHLTDKSFDDFIQALDDSVQNNEKVRVPIIWNTDDGGQRVYICSIAYEGNIGTSSTIVVTFNNVTDMPQSHNDKAQSNNFSDTDNRLWNCVKKLVSAHNLASATNSILQEVMHYYNADRGYIFEFEWDQNICVNTYESCAPDVEPMIGNLQDVPIEVIDTWIKLFDEKSLIRIKDLNDLIGDESRKDEYDILAAQEIQSLIAAPVYFNDKLVGFLGVDNPKTNMEDTTFIESLAFLCVTESLREKEKESLEKMSLFDPLTGAYNRTAWEQHQKKLQRRKVPFSLMMIDIDDYKNVNDNFGHQIGDEILKKLVATLNDLFRMDDMVVRYGGDEFIVVLENTESGMEEIFINKVRKLNDIMSQPDDQLPGITVSAGIAFSDDCSEENLFRNADNALYYVKHSGKKRCHVYKRKKD